MEKNTWHDVPGHEDIKMGQYIVPNFVSNTIAVRAGDRDYVVISPGQPLMETWPEAWHTEDANIHLVMPNSYHFMGVKAWQETFPNHQLYASKGAIKQLYAKKAFVPRQTIHALEERQPPLDQRYSFLFPPGHRGNDVWLRKFDDQTKRSLWITCDSFLNYARLSNQPLARTLQKWLGAAPGLKMSQVVKWVILNNRRHFKQWVLRQLKKDQPQMLIPSHGEWLQDNALPSLLTELVSDRL